MDKSKGGKKTVWVVYLIESLRNSDYIMIIKANNKNKYYYKVDGRHCYEHFVHTNICNLRKPVDWCYYDSYATEEDTNLQIDTKYLDKDHMASMDGSQNLDPDNLV